MTARHEFSSCHFSGIHYAVMNALNGSGRSTSELCTILSGYPADEVRDAIRYLHRSEYIRYGSDGRPAWEVVT